MIKQIIFDIDGTLIESSGFDAELYFESINGVLGTNFNHKSRLWKNVTDSGVLLEIIECIGMEGNCKEIIAEVKNLLSVPFSHDIINYDCLFK